MNQQLIRAWLMVILISAGSAFGFQGASEWIKYESSEGRYSVLLPTQPKITTQEAATATGEKFPQYLATAYDEQAIFLVGYFDYVSGATFSLDKARDGILEAVKGELINEEPITLDGNPGRALRVSATGANGSEFVTQVRIYDLGKRVYVLQFITLKGKLNSASTERAAKYFDSFKPMKTP